MIPSWGFFACRANAVTLKSHLPRDDADEQLREQRGDCDRQEGVAYIY